MVQNKSESFTPTDQTQNRNSPVRSGLSDQAAHLLSAPSRYPQRANESGSPHHHTDGPHHHTEGPHHDAAQQRHSTNHDGRDTPRHSHERHHQGGSDANHHDSSKHLPKLDLVDLKHLEHPKEIKPGDRTPLIKDALQKTNTPVTNANIDAVRQVAQHESTWNQNAVNTWDKNYQEGHPSKGVMQMVQSTFDEYAMPGHKDIYNPLDNMMAAIRDIKSKYGSLEK